MMKLFRACNTCAHRIEKIHETNIIRESDGQKEKAISLKCGIFDLPIPTISYHEGCTYWRKE